MPQTALSITLAATLLTLAPPVFAEGCAEGAAELEVTVSGVRSSAGWVTVTVYGDERSDFLGSGKKLVRERLPAQAGVTRGCVAVPGPGTYAVAIYHDEDADKDFDRNLVGMPAEGYGFSNDAPTRLSLPDFDDVTFPAGEGRTPLAITMRY